MSKIKQKVVAVMASAFLMTSFLSGCGPVDQVVSSIMDSDKVINSNDGTSQVTVPGGWVKEDTTYNNEYTKLFLESKDAGLYFMVISEKKKNLTKDLKLDDYYKMMNEHMKAGFKDFKTSNDSVKSINGYSTRQYEIIGEQDGTKLAYLAAVVETKDSFHQLLAWTAKDNLTPNKAELQKIMDSFKEVNQK